MKEPRAFRNIGPVSETWLRAIGVHTKEQLEERGAVEVWRQVRAHGFNASLNLLYALEAAIRDLHWTALPPAVKARLKKAAEAISKE
jgi:TfoX/Sxy family transcriptional regulator of competence genes